MNAVATMEGLFTNLVNDTEGRTPAVPPVLSNPNSLQAVHTRGMLRRQLSVSGHGSTFEQRE